MTINRTRILIAMIAAGVLLAAHQLVIHPNMERYVADDGVAPNPEAMAERYLSLWGDDARLQQEHEDIRVRNPEWDFMGRTFLVLALANMALDDPARQPELLTAMDHIIDDTLELERHEGQEVFLMSYARNRPFVAQPARSIFVDGEIALMIGMRRLVAEREDLAVIHRTRVAVMVERMLGSPVLSAESYPDECWTFCNTVALAAIRLSDVLDGTDHSPLLDAWVGIAREQLTDEETGLLVSSYTLDGQHLDGPEGSSIWMASHCLLLIDEEFARDQYRRAHDELAGSVGGFGFAREWPDSQVGQLDIDSGPIVPVLQASPSSSGLALLGANAFDDEAYLRQLITSLRLAGLPVRSGDGMRYAASNHVGDAVMLYAFTYGPAWERAKRS